MKHSFVSQNGYSVCRFCQRTADEIGETGTLDATQEECGARTSAERHGSGTTPTDAEFTAKLAAYEAFASAIAHASRRGGEAKVPSGKYRDSYGDGVLAMQDILASLLVNLMTDLSLAVCGLPDKPTDVHTETAARLFGVAASEVTPEQRRQAKAWTFAERFGKVVPPESATSSPGSRAAKDDTLMAVSLEVMRARTKFPKGRHLLPALMEEVGELAQALLQGKPEEEVQKEAIQVACVACRIVEEGCPEFAHLDAEARQP